MVYNLLATTITAKNYLFRYDINIYRMSWRYDINSYFYYYVIMYFYYNILRYFSKSWIARKRCYYMLNMKDTVIQKYYINVHSNSITLTCKDFPVILTTNQRECYLIYSLFNLIYNYWVPSLLWALGIIKSLSSRSLNLAREIHTIR